MCFTEKGKRLSYSYFYDVIILAGGLSKRFGSDKCCFKINSKTLLERIVEQFDNPIVVSRSPREISRGILIIEKGDYLGPVKGVKEGLKYVKRDKVFITGCDFPFLSKNVADYLCSKDFDIVITINEEPQPLLGCYSSKLLRRNINKVKRLIDLLKYSNQTYLVGTNELLRADPMLCSLINVNSITDLILRPIRIKSISKIIIDNIYNTISI